LRSLPAEHGAALRAGRRMNGQDSTDRDAALNPLCRVAHTIKRTVPIFGLGPVVRVRHEFERGRDRKRKAALAIDAPLDAILFARGDLLAAPRSQIEQHCDDIGTMVEPVPAKIGVGTGRIAPAPRFGSPGRGDFIDGIGKVDAGSVIRPNIERTVALSRIAPDPVPNA
jgi:hypothetical protein